MAHEKTIAAISTASGSGAIGMVRLSGNDALEIAERIFCPINSGRVLSQMQGYTGCLGRVSDSDGDFDEAVAFVYTSPKSYTGENMVEFTCHGGSFLLDRLLCSCIAAGASLAQPGEFTKRAFLNGKLSLDEAESVIDLISSRSLQANRAALAVKDGAIFKEITAVANILLDMAAHLAAWVDYPEEDLEEMTSDKIVAALHLADEKLDKLEKGYRQGQIIKEGVDTVIAGRPNVGKSTLMNLLSKTQRSIVTHIAGTTRDVIEETALVGGILLRLSDTAGLRESEDIVEQIGVQRTRERLASCDLVLAVFDGSIPLDDEDKLLIESLESRLCVAIINKSDLELKADVGYIKQKLDNVVEISAETGNGIEELEKTLSRVLGLAELDPAAPMIANQRQLDCLHRARAALHEGISALEIGVTFDAVSVCVDDGIDALLELTGERATVSVVDRVFHNFCVGK